MKKLLICLFMFVCAISFAGCKKGEEKLVIGVFKYVTATALDNAEKGIIDGLKEAGFEDGKNNVVIKKYNPQADPSTMIQMATLAVKECDIIFAIATPVATTLKAEIEKTGIDVPVFFTAVTDPVNAKLVESKENPGGNFTGTTDMNPVAEQLELIKKFAPDAKRVGVLFTASESNSIVQVNMLKEKAKELGLEIVEKTLNNANDLKDTTQALVKSNVEVIYIPTDNIVSAGAKIVFDVTNGANIPTICGEEGFIVQGGTITMSINYEKLGKMTALMAAKYLNGEVKSASELPVEAITEFDLILGEKAKDFGITEELFK